MITLHLSKWLKDRGPPGEPLQRLNALVHDNKPVSIILYGIFWVFVLSVGAPLIAALVPFVTLFWLLEHALWNHKLIDPQNSALNDTEMCVVITGCDTGFGAHLVHGLADQGYFVFAGCLTREAIRNYEASNHHNNSTIFPILVDVTNQKHIDMAAEKVSRWIDSPKAKKKRVLHALINNAGMGRGGYIDWLDISDFEACMDVNCFGMVRMTKAFLPILKRQVAEDTYRSSRIVNVISMAGVLSGGGLAFSPYEMAKNAAEAFTDNLRLEMKMFGIHVVATNPSFHGTPLVSNIRGGVAAAWEKVPISKKREYGREFLENYTQHLEAMTSIAQWDFEVVVKSLLRVTCERRPPTQLLIGSDSRYSMILLRMVPQWVRHFVIQTLLPPQTPNMLKKPKKID